jgi:hypothetical protein
MKSQGSISLYKKCGEKVKPINAVDVQIILNQLTNQDLYLHLETTNGAYAALHSAAATPVGAYIRNGKVQFQRGTIKGEGSFRVGLKMEIGWIYAEGLTDWEVDELGRLLLAGHDGEGRLTVALELSATPFSI